MLGSFLESLYAAENINNIKENYISGAIITM